MDGQSPFQPDSSGETAGGIALRRVYLALLLAMFYAAKALLLLDGIDVSKHSAVAAAFGREYAKTGKIAPRYHRMLLDGFEWRQKSDYDVYWLATREMAEKCQQDAKAFLAEASREAQRAR